MRRYSMGDTPTQPMDSIGHAACHLMEQETTSTCRRSFWKNRKNKENESPVSSYKNSPPCSRRRGSLGSIFRRNKISSCLEEADATASIEVATSIYSGLSVITFDDNEIDGIIKSIGSATPKPLTWSPSSKFRRSSIN